MLKNCLLLAFMVLNSVAINAQCVSGDCNNGYGVALFPEKGKARYNGQFQNQKPHGFGKAEYGDGSIYEGVWQNGKWHGQGTMTLASGTRLTGTWKDSRFMGSDPAFAADQKPMPHPTSTTTPTPNSTSATPPKKLVEPAETDEEEEEEVQTKPVPKPVPPISMPSTPSKQRESLLEAPQ